MMRILRSPWVAVAAGIIAYAVATFFFLNPKRLIDQRLAATTREPEKIEKIAPSWGYQNPELDQMIAELRQAREAVRVREHDLQELEGRLKSEWQEIGAITQRISRFQAELDQTISRVKEEEAGNLKRLSKIYSAMSPEGAAKILQEMQEEQIVKILVLMKETETAPILENLAKEGPNAARRAASISDRLRLASSKPPPKAGPVKTP